MICCLNRGCSRNRSCCRCCRIRTVRRKELTCWGRKCYWGGKRQKFIIMVKCQILNQNKNIKLFVIFNNYQSKSMAGIIGYSNVYITRFHYHYFHYEAPVRSSCLRLCLDFAHSTHSDKALSS